MASSEELARAKAIMDLDVVSPHDGYEKGPDLALVRKWHERHWRTWLVVTDTYNPVMPVVYVAGSQNRMSEWRLVRYEKYDQGDPNKGWWWKCTTLIGRDDADVVMQELTAIFGSHYPRGS